MEKNERRLAGSVLINPYQECFQADVRPARMGRLYLEFYGQIFSVVLEVPAYASLGSFMAHRLINLADSPNSCRLQIYFLKKS